MPAPNAVSQVRSFLGSINFYGRFLKEMHVLRAPLNELLKKENVFAWNKECQESFDKFKDLLCSELILSHYNLTLPIIVSADASQSG